MNLTKNKGKMKLIKKHSRLLQLKEGNRIIFEILISRSGNRFNSFKNGLGIVSESKSIDECIDQTFSKINMINEDFKKRLITL
jgi:hypothetical protein